MPELPEVETVRLGLACALQGRRLVRVRLRRADLRRPFPTGLADWLTGRIVRAVRRRAKFLLLDLEGGKTLVMHMGMSGRFTVREGQNPGRSDIHPTTSPEGSGEGKHDHVVFETDDGARIVFTDPRRFGLMTLLATATLEADDLFKGLGPEPLGDAFSPQRLAEALKGRKTPIKSALLDQHVVAGLGNIYVSEALFRAGISPKRLAKTISAQRAKRLVPAIKTVLCDAIAAGGSSLRDYAKANGELGHFQHHFAVYDREGKPCPQCGGRIARIVQAGRSTFYCPHCQR